MSAHGAILTALPFPITGPPAHSPTAELFVAEVAVE